MFRDNFLIRDQFILEIILVTNLKISCSFLKLF